LNGSVRPEPKADESVPRAIGSPLPTGFRAASQWSEVHEDPQRPMPAPAPRRALPPSSAPPPNHPSTLQRAVNVFRTAMPYVQRILPLLDGNVGTAVSNMLAPRPHTPPPPSAPVDLAPIRTTLTGLQSGLTELQTQNRELRSQVVEQNSSLKKVEDQLQHVREATDRNTLEQQELLGDLKSVGRKVNFFAYFALSLLGLSVLLNVALFLRIWRILP